jgi:hypothetical protein
MTNKKNKGYFIFFEDNQCMIISIKPSQIDIDMPSLDSSIIPIHELKRKIKKPIIYETITIKINPVDVKGKPNYKEYYILRKILGNFKIESKYPLLKYSETKSEYLKREKRLINEIIKR